jgi:hypothetical protein
VPTDPVFIWYQMHTTMKGSFITGLSLDLGFIDAAADWQYWMGVAGI